MTPTDELLTQDAIHDVMEAPAALSKRAAVWYRRRWALCMLFLLAVVAVGALAANWRWQADIAALNTSAEQRLTSLSAALLAPADRLSYLPKIVANYPIVMDAAETLPNAAGIDQLNILLQNLNKIAQSEAIYIMNTRGVTIAASNWQDEQSFVGMNYSFRPYFQEAMRSGQGHFYGMGTTSLLPGFYQASAIKKNGVTVGVAVVKVDLTRFGSDWKAADEMFVSDANGVIFLSSRPQWKYRPLRSMSVSAVQGLSRTRQYEAVLRAPLHVTVVKQIGPREQLIKFEPIGEMSASEVFYVKRSRLPDSDWTLHLLVPLAPTEQRAMQAALLSTVVFLFLSLLYLYLMQLRRNFRQQKLASALLEKQHQRLHKISQQLRVSSTTDPLTGAFNRRYFFEVAHRLLEEQRRTSDTLSIVMIDLDHFKTVNDTYGHQVGDLVLQQFAAMAREIFREVDIFARFGGEEFVAALPNTGLAAAMQAAERLRLHVSARPFNALGVSVAVSVSCGVAQYKLSETEINQTIGRADSALYQAKENGRNQVCSG